MFSGHGIYADGWCFALSLRGEIYLRTDAESAAALAAAGSTPFVYQRKNKSITTNLWRLVETAYDDPDEIKRWSSVALAAARRIGEAKAEKAKCARRRRRQARRRNLRARNPAPARSLAVIPPLRP